jgi:DNA-directed RNA polymerase subunit RPC12/RpoP
MTGYQGSCPSCGATVEFRLGASLLKVCDHCGSAVARKGADLASYGQVAAPLPTPSVLKLGIEGRYPDGPSFTLVGRLQLDYGAGTWDEWMVGFDNDTWVWLSESQGRFHYMAEVPLPPVPNFGQLDVGETVDLGNAGIFVVAEVREARFMTASGELPFDVEPGSMLRYADLSGANGAFGTLDYGTGDTAEAVYVGREVTLAELGIKIDADDLAKRTDSKSLSCTQCGGPLELKAPDQTQRVACPYCGSLLDATGNFAVLEAMNRPSLKPAIPLGTEGRLRGIKWSVIGCMERSVTVEGIRYPWREYLLYEPNRGFRWLVESKGHWSFVETIGAGDIHGRARPRYKGVAFDHFQAGLAEVDHVLGEFYWTVARGDKSQTSDYIAPPQMLSVELAGDDKNAEETWTLGSYVEPEEIEQAFNVKGQLPRREGVGPQQPSPWEGRVKSLWTWAALAAAAMFFVYMVLLFTSAGSFFRQDIALAPGSVSGAPEAAVFTEPFVVPRKGNLQVKVTAPVSNSWLYVGGALINEETGGLDEFDVEVSQYSGVDGGESWSEGSTSGTTFIPAVPAGRYVMRLSPQWQAGLQPSHYEVSMRSRVPRFGYLFLGMVLLFIWPLIAAWRSFRFNVARWADSDHPHFQTES